MKISFGVPILVQSGTVERGIGKAGENGFPTLNISVDETNVSGTYAGKVIVEQSEYNAVIYANSKRKILEAHLLDFSGDLYGRQATVILLFQVAEEKTFRDAEDEKDFIEGAVTKVRDYFNSAKTL